MTPTFKLAQNWLCAPVGVWRDSLPAKCIGRLAAAPPAKSAQTAQTAQAQRRAALGGIVWLLALFMGAMPAVSPLRAEEPSPLLRGVERGLALVSRGARNYPRHRDCFSCHHQTLPLMALDAARAADLPVDRELIAEQLAFSKATFAARREALERGARTGGWAITVAYGLWTFELANMEPDEISDAMVVNLTKIQEDEGFWRPQSIRPPIAESLVSCTVLSAYQLDRFARGEQRQPARDAIAKANAWLEEVKLERNEDFAFRLAGLVWLGGAPEAIDKTRQALVEQQRPDGGWAQLPALDSDAYATGQALWALRLAGVPRDARALTKGRDFLLRTQLEDGSWHVKTRARPVQRFFDNGDPHGVDQFISISATAWATTALAQGLTD